MLYQFYFFDIANFVSLLLGSPSRGPQMEALPPLDPTSQQLCWSGLTCLAHYLCWVPLSSVIRPQLLSTIFHFAAFGCQAKPDINGTTSSSAPLPRAGHFSSSTHKLGELLLCCWVGLPSFYWSFEKTNMMNIL